MKVSLSKKIALFMDALLSTELLPPPSLLPEDVGPHHSECLRARVQVVLFLIPLVIVMALAGFSDNTFKNDVSDSFFVFSFVVIFPCLISSCIFIWFGDVVLAYNVEFVKKYGVSVTGIVTKNFEHGEKNGYQGHTACVVYTFDYESTKYTNTQYLYRQGVYLGLEIGDEIPIKFLMLNPQKSYLMYEGLVK